MERSQRHVLVRTRRDGQHGVDDLEEHGGIRRFDRTPMKGLEITKGGPVPRNVLNDTLAVALACAPRVRQNAGPCPPPPTTACRGPRTAG